MIQELNNSFKIHNNSNAVEYQTNQAINQQVVDKIIDWCKEHDCFAGEVLCQNDDCLIDAPDLIGSIIDKILKFNTKEDE